MPITRMDSNQHLAISIQPAKHLGLKNTASWAWLVLSGNISYISWKITPHFTARFCDVLCRNVETEFRPNAFQVRESFIGFFLVVRQFDISLNVAHIVHGSLPLTAHVLAEPNDFLRSLAPCVRTNVGILRPKNGLRMTGG